MEDTPGTMRWEDGEIEIESFFFFFSCVSGFQFFERQKGRQVWKWFLLWRKSGRIVKKRRKKNDVCVIYGVVELFIEGSEWEWSKNIKGSRM